jgi:4a-hydroxytetrahydrobiopterin dehydratase
MEPPDGWEEIDGALQREFRFDDFAGAIDFVNRIAEVSERANHHPDIAIHWNRVTLRWWSWRSEATRSHADSQIALAGERMFV